MPNIRDFMNKNNITSSSRDSQQIRRVNVIPEQRYDRERYEGPLGSNLGSYQPNQPYISAPLATNKYTKSKGQCVEQLTKLLQELDRKDMQMRKMGEMHNAGVLKKFNSDYDNLSDQILRTVETYLKQNKQRLLSQIRERRNIQYTEVKPIKRNIDRIRNEVTTLREGLYRQNQYRQYISRIVLKDFESELGKVQQDIQRLRFPNVDLSIDQKYYTCFKNDLNKIIVARDELHSRMHEQLSYSPQSYLQNDDINSHLNRDQIKRSQQKKFI